MMEPGWRRVTTMDESEPISLMEYLRAEPYGDGGPVEEKPGEAPREVNLDAVDASSPVEAE
jgi:hypothetical protein